MRTTTLTTFPTLPEDDEDINNVFTDCKLVSMKIGIPIAEGTSKSIFRRKGKENEGSIIMMDWYIASGMEPSAAQCPKAPRRNAIPSPRQKVGSQQHAIQRDLTVKQIVFCLDPYIVKVPIFKELVNQVNVPNLVNDDEDNGGHNERQVG